MLDPTVVPVASAVEANLVNTGLLRSFGDDPADDRRGGLVPAILQLGLDLRSTVLAETRVVGLVVDHLGVMCLELGNGQTGPF